MATSQVIKVSGQTVEWELVDVHTVEAATGNIYWCNTVGGDTTTIVPFGDTESYWYVKRITLIPAAAQTTGGYCRLYDNAATTAGVVLCQFNFRETTGSEIDVQSYDFGDKGYRCRPVYPSTLQSGLITGSRLLFHLV